ncbi:MAG: hypothetical protein IPK82_33860 [Polyangiaceae bacterium]|nr:hypothetical protein [Polyangiaceae bacterium]
MKKIAAFCLGVLVCLPPLLPALACSDNPPETESSTTTDGSSTTVTDSTSTEVPADLLSACKALCAAKTAAACPGWAPGSCEFECQEQQAWLDGFCEAELTGYYVCAAGVEYVCDGAPVAPDGLVVCPDELAAADLCRVNLPCKMWCRAIEEAGCGQGEQLCLDNCHTASPQEDCAGEINGLLICEAKSMQCVDGVPAPVGCEQALQILENCALK